MKITALTLLLLWSSITTAKEFCTELDKEALFNQSKYVIDIEIVKANLEPDTKRHELAKAVAISFKEKKSLKKTQGLIKSLRYESPFIPANGQSLLLFQKGAQYRIFFDEAAIEFDLKPCINAVPLNVSL